MMNSIIGIVLFISIFNFIFIYSVAKTVMEHNQIISLLVKDALLLTEFHLSSNTITDKKDKNEQNNKANETPV